MGGGAFKFVYLSGMGATRAPGRFTPLFGRVKGEAELALLSLRSSNPDLLLYNLRPGFIDEEGVKRKEGAKPWSYRVMDSVAPLLRATMAGQVVSAGALATCAVQCVKDGEERVEGKGIQREEGGRGWLIENSGVRRLGGT